MNSFGTCASLPPSAGGAPSFIHYVSIDTEGSELEILSVFPFDLHVVGAFSVEHLWMIGMCGGAPRANHRLLC